MKSLEALLRTFVELHPEDAARAFESLEAGERIRLFKTLPSRIGLALSQRISPHAVAPLVSELEAGRAAELLRDLPPRVASTILHQFDERDSRAISVGFARQCVAGAARVGSLPGQHRGRNHGAASRIDPQ